MKRGIWLGLAGLVLITLTVGVIRGWRYTAENPAAETTRTLKPVAVTAPGGASVGVYQGSYALVIGNGDYRRGWSTLDTVTDEAHRVATVLSRLGFDKVLERPNLDGAGLRREVEDFIAQYGLDERHRLLIYFSGHGYTRKAGRKGYLVPVDAPDPLQDEAGFVRTAVSMDEVATWARKIEARHALFLFDSCFSGTVFTTRAGLKDPPHIEKLTMEPVRAFITAGGADEEVPSRSVFTPVLLDGLEQGLADLDHDGYVTGTELGLYLSREVPKSARQNPQFGKLNDYDYARGDFVFRLAASEPPPAAAMPSAGGVSDADRLRLETVYWDGAKDSREQRVFQDYLDKCAAGAFPCTFRIPAEARLAELQGGPAAPTAEPALAVSASPDPPPAAADSAPAVSPGWLARLAQWAGGAETGASAPEATGGVEAALPGMIQFVAGASTPGTSAAAASASVPAPPVASPDTAAYPEPEMIRLPGGTFVMGSPDSESGRYSNEPQRRVTVRGFAIGKYEVTQAEWRAVMGDNPSYFKSCDRCPVEKVSWHDVQTYIDKLNARTGGRYRLPTEEEWEYACRAGGAQRYCGSDDIEAVAWYGSNSGGETHPVGQKRANRFGLYDLSGNVWEWTGSCHEGDCSRRVNRGGSWYNKPDHVRAANRDRNDPTIRFGNLGFRLAQD